jgi:hypothetical protein
MLDNQVAEKSEDEVETEDKRIQNKIPVRVGTFISCVCCVLCRGLCNELIIHPGEVY